MIKFLDFIRITDPHDGRISLTNIAMIVAIVKLAAVQTSTVFDLGTLLLALANYNAKKWFAPNLGGTIDESSKESSSGDCRILRRGDATKAEGSK